MAAVIVSGGNVLACAVNGARTGRHAELRAISRDRDFSGATIYVARHSGGISRPCRMCFEVIKAAGITKMVFIDEAGHLTSKKVGEESSSSYKRMDVDYSK